MPAPPISSLPSVPNPIDSEIIFNAKAFALVTALVQFIDEANAQAVQINADATAAAGSAAASLNSALQAAISATASSNSSLAAAMSIGASGWVSGATFNAGVLAWSPLNGRVYRRITNGAGATDPSADAANWRALLDTSPSAESFFLS